MKKAPGDYSPRLPVEQERVSIVHVISVINYKGGVGKTTLTANLGAELAFRGRRVLLLDLDPQASLTFSFIRPEEWRESFEKSRTIKAWFDSFDQSTPINLSSLIFTPEAAKGFLKKGRLDLIASHLGLINVDLELATELGGGSLKQTQRRYLRVHQRLAQGILKDLDSEAYDMVLIDCPPNFNIVTKNAIVASDFLLTPARPDYLSTLGIDYLIRSLQELVVNYNEFLQIGETERVIPIQPEMLGVVFTMVQEYANQPISAQRPFIRQTRELGVPIFDAYIKANQTIFANAPEGGVPVALTRYSHASHESVVRSLEAVATEFEVKLGLR
ncbi:MAG: chromosome partitioning protein [Acidobacteriota bacterium]|jgi:chromosome partitioning protein|nr:chromosome partitioning protein [Acidobacteriota bacterium]